MGGTVIVRGTDAVFESAETLLDDAATPLEQLRAAEALHAALHRLAGPAAASARHTDGAFGRALAPADAARCLTDYVRSRRFMRAVEDALRRPRRATGPLNVLYAGSGPFASLLLPLLRRLEDLNLRVEAWDRHAAAVRALTRLRDALAIPPAVLRPRRADALTALPERPGPPDLVIIETMQRALLREPQLALMARLGRLYPRAVFIPAEIRLRLVAMDVAAEFALDGHVGGRRRVDLGWAPRYAPAALGGRVAPERLQAVSGEVWLDEAVIAVPELPPGCDTAAILTEVVIDRSHRLGDYDSGITQPLILLALGRLQGGQRLRCAMRLGPDPGPVVSRMA